MYQTTRRERWGLAMLVTLGAMCGAGAVLLLKRRRRIVKTAAHAAELHAHDNDMVAEGAPASAEAVGTSRR